MSSLRKENEQRSEDRCDNRRGRPEFQFVAR
jgi:hypothetical protein